MSVWHKIAVLVMVFNMSTTAMAEDKKAEVKNATPEQEKSDKLDLKQLEDKYWSAKDTDFGVVQNRTYTKEKRFFGTVSFGTLLNDAYSTGKMLGLNGGYFFSERWGVEIAQEKGTLTDNASTSYISNFNGLKPNFNKYIDYTSLNVLWVPMYAKMSVLDRAIWYFDVQVAAGVGNLNYQAQIDPTEGTNVNKSAVGYNLDLSAQVFFHRLISMRLDLKNKWTTQDLTRFRLSGSGASSRNMGTQMQQDTTLLLGINIFLPASK